MTNPPLLAGEVASLREPEGDFCGDRQEAHSGVAGIRRLVMITHKIDHCSCVSFSLNALSP